MKKIKIMIADDHEMIREMFIAKISSNKKFTIVGEASNGKEVIAKVKKLKPDIVLMDIMMPVMDGLKATKTLLKIYADLKILILSSHEDVKYILESLTYGAKGYILKTASLKELFTAIESLASGQVYYSKKVSEVLLDNLNCHNERNSENRYASISSPKFGLTKREMEVLTLVAKGLVNKQIADNLNIKSRTVGKHREKIMLKLDLHSVAELTSFAIKNNLI